MDDFTLMLRKFTHILTLKNATRTSIGGILGIVFYVVIQIFMPLLESIKELNFHALTQTYCIFIGIIILHIPTIKQLFKTKMIFDEDIEKLLLTLEISSKEGNMTKLEKKGFYREIIHEVIRRYSTQ